jgi:hypothetical protein
MGAKSIYSRCRKVSDFQLLLFFSWVNRKAPFFQHLTQPVQDFFVIQYQVLTTFGFSAAGPQSRKMFSVHFFSEKNSTMPP